MPRRRTAVPASVTDRRWRRRSAWSLSMAINRPAIVERIMEGQAVPAEQVLPSSFFGTSKTLKPTAFDLAGARKLLADAGFPNGFKMKMHGPNGRYTNDTKIIEAVAQMFTRLGIDTELHSHFDGLIELGRSALFHQSQCIGHSVQLVGIHFASMCFLFFS
jgi:ABC-type oligopeptide transport system substrate-binding subunit